MCDINGCTKSFASKTYLDKHMLRPHDANGVAAATPKPTRTYACDICDKVFKMKCNLKTHVASHTGEKPFACGKCDKAFVSRSHLKRHEKVHETYRCERPDCAFEADKWSLLRKHALTHKVRKNCPHCSREYVNDERFDAHVKAHELALKCPECGNCYSTKANLKAHFQAEHEGVTFKCTVDGCDKSFMYNQSLQQHLRNHNQPKLARVHVHKKVYAQELSGFVASKQDTDAIMAIDKNFRLTQLSESVAV